MCIKGKWRCSMFVYQCQRKECQKLYLITGSMILRCPYCQSKEREQIDNWDMYRVNFLLNNCKDLQKLLHEEGADDPFAEESI
jgi:hypothetical protein